MTSMKSNSAAAQKNTLFWTLGLLLALGLSLAALFAVRLRWMDLPLDRDEGEAVTLAQQWGRAEGGWPYIDFLHQKPPLVPALVRLGMKINADPVQSLRVPALLWQAGTVLALFMLAALWAQRQKLSPALAGGFASAAYVLLMSLPQMQGPTACSESFMALPLLLSLGLLTLSQGFWACLGAGVLVGVASLAKQPALLAIFFMAFGIPGKEKLRHLIPLCAGALLVWLVLVIVWANHAGLLGVRSLLDCLWLYNLRYAGQGLGLWLHGAWAAAKALAPWLLLPSLLMALAISQGRDILQRRLLLALFLSMGLGILISGRFYPHYFIALAAPLALGMGLALSARQAIWVRLFAGISLAALLASAIPVWAHHDGPELSRRIFGFDRFVQAPSVARAIEQADPRGQRLWIWGSEAQIYALTQRRPATRFLYHYPFSGEAPSVQGGDLEMVASLADPRLKVAVVLDALTATDPTLGPRLAEALRREFPNAMRVDGAYVAWRQVNQ
jgi:hypothetical protein